MEGGKNSFGTFFFVGVIIYDYSKFSKGNVVVVHVLNPGEKKC